MAVSYELDSTPPVVEAGQKLDELATLVDTAVNSWHDNRQAGPDFGFTVHTIDDLARTGTDPLCDEVADAVAESVSGIMPASEIDVITILHTYDARRFNDFRYMFRFVFSMGFHADFLRAIREGRPQFTKEGEGLLVNTTMGAPTEFIRGTIAQPADETRLYEPFSENEDYRQTNARAQTMPELLYGHAGVFLREPIERGSLKGSFTIEQAEPRQWNRVGEDCVHRTALEPEDNRTAVVVTPKHRY